jgi:hypothetical protein
MDVNVLAVGGESRCIFPINPLNMLLLRALMTPSPRAAPHLPAEREARRPR